jgi:hypothetical protein
MNRDTLRTEFFAVEGYLYHIGYIAAPRIADGGYFVDIDA